jgi:hypothetical protein
MAGGPINGSGIYGKDALRDRPASTVIVPTMLQTAADMVDKFANVTCLYDRYWYDRVGVVTYPICFFYVKGISETRQVDTSEQRVILYEPQMSGADAVASKLRDPIRPGVQEVVVDNMVVKPKTYQLEIIVPFQPGRQFVKTVGEYKQLIGAFIDIFGDATNFENYFGVASAIATGASRIIDSLGKMQNSDAALYANKNSLDAMVESKKVLTMKMWTGYDYKYVVITGLDVKKVGSEDDHFRATLNVKEMPVLTVTPASNGALSLSIDRNWAATAVSTTNAILLSPAIAMTGVVQASGGKDGTPWI